MSIPPRIFGSTNRSVPAIGLGTWNLRVSPRSLQDVVADLKEGVNLGMSHIDTAEMYGHGRSEEIAGLAMAAFKREDLFVVSKVLPSNATFSGTIKACEASLKRLQTDYLDCYLLHWRGTYPLAETMSALEKLIDDGKIKSLGVSNFDIDDLKEANNFLSKSKIACNQVLYNLGERGIERKLVQYCKANEIAVVAYTPFGNIPTNGTAQAALEQIARKYQATVRQIVLAWIVRDQAFFTIPKSEQLNHIIENAGAGRVELDDQDLESIDRHFPAPKRDQPLATG